MNCNRVKVKPPRLFNIAIGLTVANALIWPVATSLPQGHDIRDIMVSARWAFANNLAIVLLGIMVCAWVLTLLSMLGECLIYWVHKRSRFGK